MTRRLLAGVLFGVLLYSGIILWIDLDDLKAAFRGLPWWPIPAALGLSLVNYGIRFLKWERYRRLLDIRLSLGTSFLVYLSGYSMGVTPGKMGEVLKAWMVKRVTGVRIHKSAPIVVAERFTDVTGYLILMALGGIGSHPELAWVFWSTLALCAAIVFLVGSRSFERSVVWVLARLPVVKRVVPKVAGAFDSARVLLSPRNVLGPTLLSVVSWGAECVGFWLLANAFLPEGAEISLLFAIFAYAVSALVGALAIFVPGGLGVTEWSLGALLRREYQTVAGFGLDVARSKAAGAVLLIRFCTLWFGVFVGLGAFWLFRRAHGPFDLDQVQDDEPAGRATT